jgi:hypothetical protein
MLREGALKITLTAVGVLFSAGVYPVAMTLLRRDQYAYADAPILSAYVVLGILLLIAVHNPSAHRSLILFAGWSCCAQAAIMAVIAIHDASARGNFLGAVLLSIVGMPLIALAPPRQSIRTRIERNGIPPQQQ